MDAKIVFMGSPEFATPTLNALIKNYSVVGVVTQPDRPSGRGRKLTLPAVKLLAQEHNLPVIQPLNLGSPEPVQQIREWAPDLIVVAAFGQILRKTVLDLPKYGCINIHASLLPRWRGAAPIQATILHGDEDTGVTVMLMDEGLDTGPLLSNRIIPIEDQDTASTLSARLAEVGALLLLDTIPGYLTGEITPAIQDDALSTYAPMLKKSDGELDFTHTAYQLERRVRAFTPWPGTFTRWQNKVLKIHQVTVAENHDTSKIRLSPGTRTNIHKKPAIAASDGLLVLEIVQPEGKLRMPGDVFLRGAPGWTTHK